MIPKLKILAYLLIAATSVQAQGSLRQVLDFDHDWHFIESDAPRAFRRDYKEKGWSMVTLPHDWSIAGPFSAANPATTAGGALPGGTGWYRKTFQLPATDAGRFIYIRFDGVYRNSEVWINGHYLGRRPNGFISFRYDLTPFVSFGRKKNSIAVRVDNSRQPNSRWYTGSGINRNVWLIKINKIAIDPWESVVRTQAPSGSTSQVQQDLRINNRTGTEQTIKLETIIYDTGGKKVSSKTSVMNLKNGPNESHLALFVQRAHYWSPESPYLYQVVTRISGSKGPEDEYKIPLGIRYFRFDSGKGFYLNGQPMKILGVCLHSDWGALGTAVNKSAVKRQLALLKSMGCNAIRTAHNPPPPELLDLCDQMGFLVMDEAFDMWRKKKTKYDYSLDFAKWHQRDLQDQVKRDRNHPCIFMWSIGNEIREQFDSTGISLARELAGTIRQLDTTRPVVSALTEMDPDKNFIAKAGVLDVLGFNYQSGKYPLLPLRFKGQKFIATETTSALETRGHYDLPSDSLRIWPESARHKVVEKGNPDWTVSAYDDVIAYWGQTHEKAWKDIKRHDFMAGLFVWSGFDYLGEPTPYPYPARSSYFGIIDLAGFPKDIYYMYQSEWTSKPVLHLFPGWNWKKGQLVDIWAYYSQADEVELYLNGRSVGIRKKMGDSLHVSWRIPFEPGILKAVSRKDGHPVLVQEIKTAGSAYRLEISAYRPVIQSGGRDLDFVTVQIEDRDGNPVPGATNEIHFSVEGPGTIAGMDDGYEANLEKFQGNRHKAWDGLCLVIIRPGRNKGKIRLKASAKGLVPATITIKTK